MLVNLKVQGFLIDYVFHWLNPQTDTRWKYQFADETEVFTSRFKFIQHLESLGYSKYETQYLNQQLLQIEYYNEQLNKMKERRLYEF